MVEKISANVKVVGLNIEHNFLIPREMSVLDAIALIVKAIHEEYPGVQGGLLKDCALMQASSGKVLNPLCSFKQLEIVQGERLILI